MEELINGVDRPVHYNREGAMECIDEMELIFNKEETAIFCKLNAWKYRYRAGQKSGEDGLKDLQKSDWYIKKYKELQQNNYGTITSYSHGPNSITIDPQFGIPVLDTSPTQTNLK